MARKNPIVILLSLLFFSLVAGDVISYLLPAGQYFFFVWIISCLVLISASIYLLCSISLGAFRFQSLLTFLLITIHYFYVISEASNPRNLSGESTQEITCLLRHLAEAPDLGYMRGCLFQYPARQFILPALPSYLFGRSLFTLNFGGSLWFIFTLPIFASGILRYFSKFRYADGLTALSLGLIFHLRYFNILMFNYEQAIFPFCFCLGAVGFFLLYLAERSTVHLLLLALILLQAIYSYTPALSLVTASFAALSWIAFTDRAKGRQIFALSGMLAVSLGVSLLFRGDLQLTSRGEKAGQELISDVGRGMLNIITKSEGGGIASDYVSYYFCLLIALGLLWFFKKEGFLATIWIISTFIAALAMRGYTFYGIDFRLHRATVALPALIGLSAHFITKVLKQRRLAYLLVVPLAGAITISGVLYQQDILSSRSRSIYLVVMDAIEKFKADNRRLTVLRSKATNYHLGSMGDFYMYLMPDLHTDIWAPECQSLKKYLPTSDVIYITYPDEQPEPCAKNILSTASRREIASSRTQLIMYYIRR